MAVFEKRMIEGAGGVPLAVFDSHHGESSGRPTIFLVNGLGGNISTWQFVIEAFSASHRIVTWDYRGLYASRFSPELRAQALRGDVSLGVAAHAEDAVKVLEATGIEKALFIGWSMGVQLNFELFKHTADRMTGLVQICGAPGRALATTVFGGAGRAVIRPAMEVFRQATDRYASWMSRVASSPNALKVAKAIGMVAPSLDEPLAAKIVRDYMHLDFDVYNRILMSLGDHDATPFLAEIDRPVLVVAGSRDPMTPVAVSKKMVSILPRAELEVFEGGSHYLPIEFPAKLNNTLASFMRRKIDEGPRTP